MVGTQGYSYKTDDLPKSSYSLTLLPSAGVNTITTYSENPDGTLTPQYYQVKLEKTTYGDSALAGTKTYGWEQSASGNLEFKESPTAPYGGTEITAKYDTTNTGRRESFTTGENVTGNWVGNTPTSGTLGGAIFNDASSIVGDVNGDFINNYTSATGSNAHGGAIFNRNSTIGDMKSIFFGNYAKSSSGYAQGGAVINYNSTMGNVHGDFIGNYTEASGGYAQGSGLYNYRSTVGNITGNFIGNYAKSSSGYARGSAILNDRSNVGDITGNFIGNYAKSTDKQVQGSAIYSSASTINNITGDFIGNYAKSINDYSQGGAIYNANGNNDNITGDFIGNYAKSINNYSQGGAIYNYNNAIKNIDGNFIKNYVESTNNYSRGGAIFNYNDTIGAINGDFIDNYAKITDGTVQGGAIYNNTGTIDNTTGNFINNYTEVTTGVANGGAIYNNAGVINNAMNSFISNHVETTTGDAKGGAIYNTSGGTVTIKNSVFANNATIENRASVTNGGAIYNNTGGVVNLENVSFLEEGTITIDSIENTATNDIYNNGTINASGENYFGSKIGGSGSGNLKFENGAVAFIGADVSNQKITMDNNTITMGQNGSFGTGNKLTVASATNINAINGATNSMDFGEITLNDNLNMAMDVNLANSTSDSILGDVVAGDGVVNIGTINIMGTDGADNFSLKLADGTVKNRVRTNLKSHMGRIFKYGVDYDETTGLLNFRGGGSDSDGFNPNVLAASVAAQLGGYGVQLNSYDEAFRNVDMYMLSSRAQRQAMKYANRYASSDLGAGGAEYTNSPYTNGAGWFRPYGIFESVPLKNGPKVSNVMYGTFMGADSKIKELGNGWDGMLSGYLAYNGSHQSYDGIGIYQNGGTLGAMGALYKGNFFTALTANIGANAGRANTMYGHEDFAMLMGGIASKTGYNWELADGKFIIQPSYLMSYSIVNTFDYTSASGLNIDSKALHAIQMEPALKFIGNLGNGWQPYTGVSMVFNIMDKTKFSANDVSLPQLSIKPYIKYGVGVRKLWGDRFSGFAQVYMTNIGRNGVGAHAGFTYLLGEINK